MNEMKTTQPAERVETTENVESVEEQVLAETAVEPGAHVEETQTFEQAEQVEAVLLTTLVEETVEVTDQETAQKESLAEALDPTTGEAEPGAGEAQNAGRSEAEPDQAVPAEDDDQTQGVVEPVESAVPNDDAVVEAVDTAETQPAVEPANDPAGADVDQVGQDVGTERIVPEVLPEAGRIPAGAGAHGAVYPGGAGKQLPGFGDGSSMGRGSSSSGSGAPVDNPSGGTSKPKEGDGYHSGDSPSGRWLWVKSSKDNTPGVVKEPDGKGVWCMDKEGDWWYYEIATEDKANKKGDPVDGDFGVPYTGTTGGGEIPDPSEPVGPDREAGFVQMIDASQEQEANQHGYGTSGDSTFSPDGGGEGDDSGKFSGGLEGSDVRPNNPDDPDYYTPNELEKILTELEGEQK